MSKIYYKALLIFGLFTQQCYAQNVVQSNTFVEACYNNADCFMISNSGLIFLNSMSGDFLVQVDFNKFRIGNDTLDDWLNDLSKTFLIYQGQLSPADISVMIGTSNHSSKPTIINGTLNFNGISKPYKLEIFYSGSYQENTLNSDLHYRDRTTISLQMAFHAKDFNIGNRKHHYTKTIHLAIARGFINEWVPEIDFFIKN